MHNFGSPNSKAAVWSRVAALQGGLWPAIVFDAVGGYKKEWSVIDEIARGKNWRQTKHSNKEEKLCVSK